MLSKKFYDFFTIGLILLLVLSFFLQASSFSIEKNAEAMQKCVDQGLSGESLQKCIDTSLVSDFNIYKLLRYLFLGIYWIFILVLAIKLHAKKLTKISDVVIIAIIVPLAPIFYFTNLRNSLNKLHKSYAHQ